MKWSSAIVIFCSLLLSPLLGLSDGPTANIDSLLVESVTSGSTQQLKQLLDDGASPNAADHWGNTALILAAQLGDMDDVRILLNRGATLDAKGLSGETALMQAARSNHPDIIQMLLEKGADIQARNESAETALIAAAAHGRTEAAELKQQRYARPLVGRVWIEVGLEERLSKIEDAMAAKDGDRKLAAAFNR